MTATNCQARFFTFLTFNNATVMSPIVQMRVWDGSLMMNLHQWKMIPLHMQLAHSSPPGAQKRDPGTCHVPPSFQLGLKILLYPFPLSTYAGAKLASHSPWGTTSIPCTSSVCIQHGKERGLKLWDTLEASSLFSSWPARKSAQRLCIELSHTGHRSGSFHLHLASLPQFLDSSGHYEK